MPVYVNRILNLKKIMLIGFDMDYTLVRYNTAEFENLIHSSAVAMLVRNYEYPADILRIDFDHQRAIVGLVIDKRNGNLLKISRYGKVKTAYHGLEEIDFRLAKKTYQNRAIELRDPDYIPLDTSFAISNGVLYSQLVDLKSKGLTLPDFDRMALDVDEVINLAHRDRSIKDVLQKNFSRFVLPDPLVPRLLERYRDYGKKLMIITNSDYDYTKELLAYALDPYWKKYSSWRDVFDIVITYADKPRFFERPSRFLEIDAQTGLMRNYDGSVAAGLYQGGWFGKLQQDLDIPGNEILYIGDHIYGDVVSIKKRCEWRTALVLGDLENEIDGIQKSRSLQKRIEKLTRDKLALEQEINRLDIARYEGRGVDRKILDDLFERIDRINGEISESLGTYREFFNPYWGEVLRAGQEESRYAGQIENYACIYMTKVSDLYEYSPKTYFRPARRVLPHEL